MPVWSMVPFATLRTAVRYAIPLACVFALGAAAHELLILGGVELAHGDHRQLRRVGTLLIFVLIVLVQLTVTVIMLALLRNRLRPDEPRPSLVVTVTRALPPFVVIYIAWNLIAADAGAFGLADIQRNYDFDRPAEQSDAGRALIDLTFTVSAIATAAAWGVRVLCERWYERRGNPVAGVLTAYGEAAFYVFGLSSLVVAFDNAKEWAGASNGWNWLLTLRETVLDRLGEIPGADAAGAAVGAAVGSLPLLADAIGLPLLWLVVVALVYGHDVFQARQVVSGTSLESEADRLAALPAVIARPLGKATEGMGEKYLPLAIAFRLVTARGPMVLGMYVLLYAALGAAETGMYRAVVTLIGPETDPARWPVLLVPVDFGVGLVYEVLRVALLATVMLPVLSEASQEAGGEVTAAGGSRDEGAAEPPTAVPPPPPGPRPPDPRQGPAPVPGPG